MLRCRQWGLVHSALNKSTSLLIYYPSWLQRTYKTIPPALGWKLLPRWILRHGKIWRWPHISGKPTLIGLAYIKTSRMLNSSLWAVKWMSSRYQPTVQWNSSVGRAVTILWPTQAHLSKFKAVQLYSAHMAIIRNYITVWINRTQIMLNRIIIISWQ